MQGPCLGSWHGTNGVMAWFHGMVWGHGLGSWHGFTIKMVGNMELVTWQDNQPVSLLYTVPDYDRSVEAESLCYVRRRVRDGKGWVQMKVFRPEIFKIFEKYMGGVDQL